MGQALRASHADHIYQHEQMVEMMRPGKRFGSECLNVIDDAMLTGNAQDALNRISAISQETGWAKF